MDQEKWLQVRKAFERGLSLEGPDRDAFFKEMAADDPQLWAEVRRLVEADADPTSFLQGHAFRAAGVPVESPDAAVPRDPLLGTTIGPYRLDRLLGEGGMGAVYVGERADGEFQQKVALKLVRQGLATAEITERFRAERQILARLTHTNIAHLLDGGVTDDGRPWFALEFVQGRDIMTWAGENRLDIEDRVWLFLTVCDAVQFAHRNLVVHRDLKPNNILVSDEGVVKLVDFGIAKLLDEAEDPGMTRTGTRAMTPTYASPEQVRGNPVTTATDIYGLGLVLYELITGRRPFASNLSSQELERAILTEDPIRPSAANTGSDRLELTGAIAGDLDNICLMALRKDPDRRYASVSELAEDIRRFLTGHPVRARGDSVSYRLRKLVQRNRAASAAAAAAIVAITGTVGFYTGRLQEQRDLAQLEARRSSEVVEFLTGLFEQASPSETMGRSITVQELLERGAETAQRELAGVPDVRATMLGAIGKVYTAMRLDDRAAELLRGPYEYLRATRTPPDLALASAAGQLGSALRNSSRFEEAEVLLREALDQYTALLPPTAPEVVNGWNALGLVYFERELFAEARPMLVEALERAERSQSIDSDIHLRVKNNLARLEYAAGNYDLAELRFREVLAARRAESNPLSPNLLSSISNLAQFLSHIGKFEEGHALAREALEGQEQVHGADSPLVGVSLNNIASALKQQGLPARAEAYQRRALDIFRSSLGSEHQHVAMAYNNLANILHDQGKLDEAIAFHELSLPLQRKIYGEDHSRTAGSLNNLAAVYKDKGDPAAAEPLYRLTLDIDRRTLGEEHPFVAQDMVNVASAVSAQGRSDEAMALLDSAAALQNRNLDPDSPAHAARKTEYGLLLFRMGRMAEAEEQTRQALEYRLERLPSDSWVLAMTRSQLGAILVERGRRNEALPLLEEAYARLLEVKGPEAPETRFAERALEIARDPG